MPLTLQQLQELKACLRRAADDLDACLAPLTAPGISGPEAQRIAAACSAQHDAQIALCSLSHTGEADKERFDQAKKGAFNKFASELATFGAGAAVVAVFFAPAFFTAAVVLGLGAGVAWWISSDPPDPDFLRVVVPTPPVVETVFPSGGLSIPDPFAESLNGFLNDQAQVIGLLKAFVVSLERARGAAEVHDSESEQRQMDAARNFAAQIPALFSNAQSSRSKVAQDLRAANLTARISANQRREIALGDQSSAFLRQLDEHMQAFGLPVHVREVVRKQFRAAALRMDESDLVVPDFLEAPGLCASESEAAEALRRFAAE